MAYYKVSTYIWINIINIGITTAARKVINSFIFNIEKDILPGLHVWLNVQREEKWFDDFKITSKHSTDLMSHLNELHAQLSYKSQLTEEEKNYLK